MPADDVEHTPLSALHKAEPGAALCSHLLHLPAVAFHACSSYSCSFQADDHCIGRITFPASFFQELSMTFF